MQTGTLRWTSGGYEANMDCTWRMECSTDGSDSGRRAAVLLLQFTTFGTELNHDFISLADGSRNPITDGDRLSGSVTPSHTFAAVNGTLIIRFTSDGARRLRTALPCRLAARFEVVDA